MQRNLSTFEYVLVTQQEILKQVCQQARGQAVVALDTEFVRIRSYYPKLGLIQLYDGIQVSLIDPLTLSDLTPFIELLTDQNVVKVLHSGGEDLEIFWHLFQQMPTPMLDTQVMAEFLGFPNSVGFATLVEHFFSIQLDKATSRTNWLARPLSTKQGHYAASDVYYLLPIYQLLSQQLAQSSWQQAAVDECEMLIKKRQRQLKPELAYLEIGNAWRLDQQELAVLQRLAQWRLKQAIKKDLALTFIIKNESLFQIAKVQPKHTSQLLELGLHPNEIRRYGKKLLSLVEQAKRLKPHQYPPIIENIALHSEYKTAIRLLQQELKNITPTDLTSQLVASKRMLHQLLRWYWQVDKVDTPPDLLQTWRKPFGERLLEFLRQKGI